MDVWRFRGFPGGSVGKESTCDAGDKSICLGPCRQASGAQGPTARGACEPRCLPGAVEPGLILPWPSSLFVCSEVTRRSRGLQVTLQASPRFKCPCSHFWSHFFSPSPETFSWPSRLQGSLSVQTPNFNTPFTIWSSQKDPWPVMETSCPHSPSCRIFFHIYLFNGARSQLRHEASWIFVAAWESFRFGTWGLVTCCCCCLAPMSSATLLRPHGL